MKKKGRFLIPLLYKAAKNKWENLIFKNKPLLNIRSSSYLKVFENCNFKIHNGKRFVVNNVKDFKEIFKTNNFVYFKLGQFSYNRHVFMRNRRFEYNIIIIDVKKKKGYDVKHKKKKKSIFTVVK